MSRSLTLPRLGETMEEGKIVRWLKQPGDSYRRGDVLLEVETDKTTVEVPALEDGALIAILAADGTTVPVDGPIATIADPTGGEAGIVPPTPPDPSAQKVLATKSPAPAAPIPAAAARAPTPALSRPRASPAARRLARATGLDLGSLTGSGRQGRIQGWDVTPPAALRDGLAVRQWRVAAPVGDTIALVHGFGGDAAGFDRLARALNALGRSVIAIDLPAHGDSPAQTLGLKAIADQAAETLSAFGPLHLVGHSLGGAVATLAAERMRPRAITLIAPAGFSPSIAQGFLDGLAVAETPEAVGALLALTTRDALKYTSKVLATVAAHLADPQVRAARVALARELADKGRQRLDLRPVLAAQDVPTTIILGRHDVVIPGNGLIEDLPLTAQHVLDTGHMPHIEATRLVAAILTRV